MNRNRFLVGLWLALTAAFIFGLSWLFRLRYQSGEVYPPYSSLRADPLGTKVLFESLQRLSDLVVTRNLFDLDKLALPRATTLFYVALQPSDLEQLDEREFNQWEDLVLGGGRLVLSFESTRIRSAGPKENKPAPAPPESPDNPDDPRQGPRRPPPRPAEPPRPGAAGGRKKLASPRQRWGFDFDYAEIPGGGGGVAPQTKVERRTNEPLLPELSWHSTLIFSSLDNQWATIYGRAAGPVLIEKPHGLGSIVLMGDSYLLSNEAMRLDRQPELLAWLTGPSKTIAFDETHFGIVESPGLMSLARKYRLHGLFAGLIVLGALFVWKNAVPFVPGVPSAESADQPVGGRDSLAGFVNLLRRSVSGAQVARVCFEQWRAIHSRESSRQKLERMELWLEAEQLRPARERNPLRTYRELARIWNERKL